MSFGFPASYLTCINTSVSFEIFEKVAISAFESLGWKFHSRLHNAVFARVPMSGASWGEEVKVLLAEPGELTVESTCTGIQLFDWGKNRRNVEHFIDMFEAKGRLEAKSFRDARNSFDEQGTTPIERVINE